MRFSRGVHRHFVLSFSVKKSWGQWLRFPAKVKKPHFWPYFWKILNDPDFFRKIRLRHFVSFIVLQLHAKFWKDPMIGFREKLRTDRQTHRHTDRQGSIYRTNLQSRWVQKMLKNEGSWNPISHTNLAKNAKTYLHASGHKISTASSWGTNEPILKMGDIGLQNIFKWEKSNFWPRTRTSPLNFLPIVRRGVWVPPFLVSM